MKNLLLIPLTILALSSVRATDLPSLSAVEDKTLVLYVNDWNDRELKISFLTTEGEEVFSEMILPTSKPKKKYNLQILRGGSYEVVLSNEIRSITYDLEVTDKEITKLSKGAAAHIPHEIRKDIKSKILSFN